MTTADGRTYTARAVVSNASPFATLGEMIDDQALESGGVYVGLECFAEIVRAW